MLVTLILARNCPVSTGAVRCDFFYPNISECFHNLKRTRIGSNVRQLATQPVKIVHAVTRYTNVTGINQVGGASVVSSTIGPTSTSSHPSAHAYPVTVSANQRASICVRP